MRAAIRGPARDSQAWPWLANICPVSGDVVTEVGIWRYVDKALGVPPWEGSPQFVASPSPERAGRLTAPEIPDRARGGGNRTHGDPSGRGLCRRAPARHRSRDGCRGPAVGPGEGSAAPAVRPEATDPARPGADHRDVQPEGRRRQDDVDHQ